MHSPFLSQEAVRTGSTRSCLTLVGAGDGVTAEELFMELLEEGVVKAEAMVCVLEGGIWEGFQACSSRSTQS